MNRDKLILIILATFIASIVIYTSVKIVSSEQAIYIEAENAIEISSPFEVIKMAGASKGKAVTTTMRSDEFESFLEYKIKVDKKSKFRFWANCFWPGGCNNSFVFQIDEGNRYVFGNDKHKFEPWHYRYIGLDAAYLVYHFFGNNLESFLNWYWSNKLD